MLVAAFWDFNEPKVRLPPPIRPRDWAFYLLFPAFCVHCPASVENLNQSLKRPDLLNQVGPFEFGCNAVLALQTAVSGVCCSKYVMHVTPMALA